MRQAPTLVQCLGKIGVPFLLRTAVNRLWSEERYLGLVCDLSALPAVRPAKIKVVMEARDLRTFGGFEQELKQVSGSDAFQIYLRIRSRKAGVSTLYAANQAGGPVFCQWLITPDEQEALFAHSPHSYDRLKPDEVLIEGAYTFLSFRGMGVMTDGISQVLHIAHDLGARRAITYVAQDNAASLAGCARAGFVLDHLRISKRRWGSSHSQVRHTDAPAQDAWAKVAARTAQN